MKKINLRNILKKTFKKSSTNKMKKKKVNKIKKKTKKTKGKIIKINLVAYLIISKHNIHVNIN